MNKNLYNKGIPDWLGKPFDRDLNILIWDDKAEGKLKGYFQDISEGLQEHGWRVIVTADKEKTIEIATKGRCDVVVLDLMENGDPVGSKILRRLREKKPYLPIIMFSEAKEMQFIRHAIRGDASYYLPRPINSYHDLIRAVEVAIETEKTKEKLMNERYYSSLGEVAAGVAHFIKNSLWNIGSRAQYLLEKTDKDNEAYGLLEVINRRCEDANKVVVNLLNFARNKDKKAENKKINIIQLIEDLLELLNHEFKYYNISVERKFIGEKLMITGDEISLREAFLNIVKNAVEAMRDGGTLSIEVSAVNSIILISISDTGEGMSHETMERLFIPFHTTKPNAVGFGLFETNRIIENHDGCIRIDSEVGKGSAFVIELPCKKESAKE